MIARISSHFPCSESELWQRIIEPRSLQFVAAPLLTFVPVEAGALEEEWQVGRDYPLQLYFLNVIPLGRHSIRLVTIDRSTNTILSEERGSLARVWNHRIHFQQVAPGKLAYTDEIEIKASWLTPLIWAFAQVFYRHRQRRWKVLLKRKG
tara:strand:- start:44170 stop:44619 length:450 start_codon:yes stop_codon:yes gene_type:complete